MSEHQPEGQQALPEGEIAPTPADDNVPASGTEQPSSEPEATPAEPEPKKVPWFQRRIDELTREKHEERRQREALEARLQQQPRPQAQQPAQQQPAAPQPGMISMADAEKLVEQTLTVRQFNEACNAIAETGEGKYADFDSAVSTFSMLGGPPPAFLEALTEFSKEEAARLYYDLGKNPDEAARVTKLSPAKMAVALAKMVAAPAKALPVSRTPAPISPITSNSGTRAGAEPDAKDQAAWTDWFNKKRMSR